MDEEGCPSWQQTLVTAPPAESSAQDEHETGTNGRTGQSGSWGHHAKTSTLRIIHSAQSSRTCLLTGDFPTAGMPLCFIGDSNSSSLKTRVPSASSLGTRPEGFTGVGDSTQLLLTTGFRWPVASETREHSMKRCETTAAGNRDRETHQASLWRACEVMACELVIRQDHGSRCLAWRRPPACSRSQR